MIPFSTKTVPQPTRTVRQRPSHQDLAHSPSRPSAEPRATRLDAIVVPASRPAHCLQSAIDLAVKLGTRLVILCSRRANINEVERQVAATPGTRAVLISIPSGWSHQEFPTRTSHETFRRAQAGRATDLSTKRNIGLVLARLLGWNKIVFLDDDITWSASLGVLAGQLERHQVAGMVVRNYPDNSVVCHARRLAGLPQDVFVTGAVLGVYCSDLPLSFFPDIYNEDWFFFANKAAARELPQAGLAVQLKYDPFASPSRARHEEFGDLLAEGLFALFGKQEADRPFETMLKGATEAYWRQFIEARFDLLEETLRGLHRSAEEQPSNRTIAPALNSLDAAQHQLVETISPSLCADFVDAWQSDVADWQTFTSKIDEVGSPKSAMDVLGLTDWRSIG